MPNTRFWTINGDFIGLKPNGVARYAREATVALDKLIVSQHPLTAGLELRLVTPREPVNAAFGAIKVRTVQEFGPPRLPQFWVQAQLPRFVKGGLLSFCNLAPVTVRRQIACIHDLHTVLMPQSYGRGFRLAHRLILPALGRVALRITTVSNLSKGHLVAHGIAGPGKIAVTYNGCDHALRWNASNSRLEFGPRPFVLFLGQPQAYKNAGLIWRISPELDRQGIDVCVAGDMGQAAVAALGVTPANLRLLGRIGDDDLAAALAKALCFLFPSRIEGFGIPLAEAMARGCPVIASSASCLPEVGGAAAMYCDPDDAEGWIAQIMRLQSGDALRDEMRRKGLRRAALYSWENVALTYLRLMAEIDGIA